MKNGKRQKIVVILGATASGKTGTALNLCRIYNGCIISADSRQVYRYMDIGTGKVSSQQELVELQYQREELLKKGVKNPYKYRIVLQGVDNYMIDFRDPKDMYNVALYQKEVYRCIFEISRYTKQSQNLFLVGGTGQYIDAIVENWQFPEGEPSPQIRTALMDRFLQQGIESLWEELLKRDPDSSFFVQRQNPRRVIRALEYVMSTGKKFSKERKKGKRPFEVLKIGIQLPREELYKKIDTRVDDRLSFGMIEEVEALQREHGLSWERLRNFGLEYRVIADYLCGIISSKKDMSQRLQWDIHSFARRQLTWFRKDKHIQWVTTIEEAKRLIEQFFK